MLEYLFLIKKRDSNRCFQRSCFPVKFLRTTFFKEHFRWLLLTVQEVVQVVLKQVKVEAVVILLLVVSFFSQSNWFSEYQKFT